ncbi:MAG: orotidine-5'-phosphate decarboxylase [Armatimonadetes bacterium]|nr:orotidine-5'-phosphate decarboxylase [Armatimonadota bacterium]
MTEGARRIIVALDTSDPDEALTWSRALAGEVGAFKVGLELIHAAGPPILERIRDESGARIFYDGKFNDIPHTVRAAARQAARRGVWLFNVHALSGSQAMRAALAGAQEGAPGERPLVAAVTLLTSLSEADLEQELGIRGGVEANVVRLARLAQDAGLDGAIASPREAAAIRRACEPGFLIITPGVRLAGSEVHDQVRVATPGEAVRAGADYVVVGRTITAATDPVAAARAVAADIDAALVAEEHRA